MEPKAAANLRGCNPTLLVQARTGALDQFQKARIGTQRGCFEIGILEREKDSDWLAVICNHQWFLAGSAGVIGEAFGRIVHFHDLHNAISSPPMRTTFRSLTPTAKTLTTKVRLFLHFVVYAQGANPKLPRRKGIRSHRFSVRRLDSRLVGQLYINGIEYSPLIGYRKQPKMMHRVW
jgi:hypothetical protein